MSGVRLSRAYMPGMLKRNWGRIVFISSESALNIPKEMIHYGMTKTAQLAVSRGLAEMTRGTAVTVNSVLPGPTMSEGVESLREGARKQNGQSVEEAASQFVKQFRPTSLLQRFATVEEIANMVVYVASKEASATNGAALRAEGGIVQTDRVDRANWPDTAWLLSTTPPARSCRATCRIPAAHARASGWRR